MLALVAAVVVGSAPVPPVLAGYLPSWRFSAYDLDRLKGLTDVLYFSVEPTAEGGIDTKHADLEDLPKLAAAKRKHGFRTLLCVGGWERSANFASMARHDEFRARFVRGIDAFLTQHGFDGVDLDWEHPRDAEEAKLCGTLIQDLRAVLRPKNRIVTAAIALWQPMHESAVAGLDRVHLMSYDYDVRHSTLEQAKKDVNKAREMGFSPDRIVLGVPLYGRKMENRNVEKTYADILTEFKPGPDTDEAGGFSYNGPKTVEAKAALVHEFRLGGLMVWEATQDAPGEASLLARMLRVLKRVR